MNLAQFIPSFLKKPNLPWWIEVKTTAPQCTYYFGPFDSQQEAEQLQAGYVEDLQMEHSQGISVAIKQTQPNVLTISGD
jgi:hypothetical protein